MQREIRAELRVKRDRQHIALAYRDRMTIHLGQHLDALTHVLDLPITGKEEDAADQLSTYLLADGSDEGEQAVLEGAPRRCSLVSF